MLWFLAQFALPALILGGLVYSFVRAVAKRCGWKRSTLARVRKILLGTALVVFAVMARLVSMIPGMSGSLMMKDSPDGRYRAECWTGVTEGFFGGTESYLRLVVVETASGKEVALREERMPHPAMGGDDRDGGGVHWGPGSTRVTFHLREGEERVIEVPR